MWRDTNPQNQTIEWLNTETPSFCAKQALNIGKTLTVTKQKRIYKRVF